MKKKVLALVLTLAMLASLATLPAAAVGSKTYPDAVGHWAEESILRWSRCGLVKGDNLGNVNPDKPLRRCEMATILSDMLGLRTAAPISTFKDINGSEWYARAILRCAAAGIMEGSNSMCYPEDHITREEAIVMFSRALGVVRDDDPDLSEFLDGDEVSGWAAPYMAALTELGILSGMGDGTVAPHADINRAGAFTLMDKAISVYANAPGTYNSQNANGFVVINANSQQEGEVIVTGKATGVLVAVGATNAVKLRNLESDNVLVNGKTGLTVTGKSELAAVSMNVKGDMVVESEATVDALSVNAEEVTVSNSGTVKTLSFDVSTTVTNSGTVDKLVADADATVTNTGTVNDLVVNQAIKVDNTKGVIKNAEINMGGVVIDGAPQKMTLASGVARPTGSNGRPVNATGSTGSTGSGGGGGGGSTSVSVTGVTLDVTGWVMNVGDTKTLTATVEPSNASNKNVTWTSSDEAVATVASGKITAIKEGTATITVTTSSGKKTASCEITVRPEGSTDPIPVKSVTFDKTELELEAGSNETLILIIDPANATVDGPALWASSDTDVVTVDQTGKLTAVAPGRAEITATVTVPTPETPDPEQPGEGGDPVDPADPENPGEGGGTTDPENPGEGTDPSTPEGGTDAQADNGTTYTAKCEVTVKAKPEETVAVTGVTLDKDALELEVDGTATLTPTVAPANASNKKVTWTSSDNTKATVENGVVTGVAAGDVTITATTEDGGKTAECAVTVKAATVVDPDPVVVTGVTLDKDELELEVDGTATLIATVAPANASNKKVTWTSSDNTKATVENGVVTGVAAGDVTITVTTEDGGKTAECAVTVKAKSTETVAVTGVTLDKDTLELEVDGTATLTPTVAPANASNKKVTWTSDDPETATVDENGLVTAKKAGNATITVTTEDGGFTAECEVTVTGSATPVEPVVALNKTEVTLTLADDPVTERLSVTVDGAAADEAITWASDNEAVATVAEGVVTARAAGKASITATLTVNEKEYTLICTVTVEEKREVTVSVTGISVTPTEISAKVGDTIESLVVTITPDNATNKNVTWTSSAPDVVTVENGNVTIVGAGTATITVKSEENPEISASCTITVTEVVVELDAQMLDMKVGDTESGSKTLTATVKVNGAADENATVTWNVTSGEGVVTIAGETTNTITITAAQVGTATITATYEERTATCTITVAAADTEPTEPGGGEDQPTE